MPADWKPIVMSMSRLDVERPLVFVVGGNEIASIDREGVMRFAIEASDENAQKFVDCIKKLLGRTLTGIDVEKRGG